MLTFHLLIPFQGIFEDRSFSIRHGLHDPLVCTSGGHTALSWLFISRKSCIYGHIQSFITPEKQLRAKEHFTALKGTKGHIRSFQSDRNRDICCTLTWCNGGAFYCDGPAGAQRRTRENKGCKKAPDWTPEPTMLLLLVTIWVKFNSPKRCSEVVSKDGDSINQVNL